jgi:hypothetical protein
MRLIPSRTSIKRCSRSHSSPPATGSVSYTLVSYDCMKENLHPEMTRRLHALYEYGPNKKDSGDRARCLVRIWDTGESGVVMLTELPDNPGMSVTNACEDIATRIVQDFGINPQRTRFIEHYPEEKTTHHGIEHVRKETFDEIFFTWDNRSRADEPHWKPLAKEEVERLVGDLE